MSELGKRVSVAAVGIPLVLGLLYRGGWLMAVPLASLAAWGTHELYRLVDVGEARPHAWVGVPASAAFVLLATWRPTFSAFAPYALALVAATMVASIVGALASPGPRGKPLEAVSVTLLGSLYAGLALAFAPLLIALPHAHGWTDGTAVRSAGLLVIALPLAATWVGDAAAYFAGSAWGRAKLAPSISPNKSWVGFWATLAGAAAASMGWYYVADGRLTGVTAIGPLLITGVGLLLGLAAVIGDLVESLLKREAGVKDSGGFFPGHGGVLDRVDSLVFTIPASYVLLELLARFT